MVKKIFDILPPQKIDNYVPKELNEERLKSVEKKEPEMPFRKHKRVFLISKKYVLTVIAFFMTIAVFIVLSAYSDAEIEVWPKTEILPLQIKVSLDKFLKEVDLSNKAIPAEVSKIEKTASGIFVSSGKKIKEEKAAGVIRIYNDYSVQQILMVGTRLQAPAEKFQPSLDKGENPWFKTKERIVIPPKSHKDVNVVADASGPKYNIDASIFSIPGLAGFPQYTYIYGKSTQKFAGGVKAEFPEVLQGDLDKAEKEVSDKAVAECLIAVKGEFSPLGSTLKDELFKTSIVDKSFSATAGSESEKFNYQAKAKSEVISFKDEDVRNLVMGIISSQLPEGKSIHQESLKIDYSVNSSDFGLGKAVISLDVKVKIYSGIDEKSLKDSLKGKPLNSAEALLRDNPQITRVQVRLWPFWVKKVVDNGERIKVKLLVD